MKTTCISLGAAILASCLPMGTLFAQTPGAPATPPIAQVSSHSAVVVEPPAPGLEPKGNRSGQRLFNGHGTCCLSDFNYHGCGNLCSNLTFMLGSCRAFFGQTCIPNPPHGVQTTPGQNGMILNGLNPYDYPSGTYGTNGQRGCNSCGNW